MSPKSQLDTAIQAETSMETGEEGEQGRGGAGVGIYPLQADLGGSTVLWVSGAAALLPNLGDLPTLPSPCTVTSRGHRPYRLADCGPQYLFVL